MRHRFMWGFGSTCVLGFALLMAPPAHATPASYDLSFVTTDQSLWDTGKANVFNKTEFLGVAWQDKGATLNAITGNTDTQVPNPARVAYDVAYGACRLVASASACINGQSGQLPVAALGNRPSVRSCSWWDVGCQFARGGDVIAQAGYDVAFGACTLVHSASVCRNGQAARLPVAALGTPPAPFSTIDTRTGFAVGGNSDGRVGLNVGIHADSGSVNATVSYRAALDIPDTTGLSKANPINFNPSSQLAGTNSLQTTFPTVSLSVDAVMQLSGYIYGEGCVVLTGCARDTTSFNVNETRPVVSFNADGQGGVQLFGRSPSDFGLPTAANGFPLDLDVAGLATVTVHLPQPNASGGLDAGGKSLTAHGQDDLVDLSLDVDNIIATAVGAPGLFGNSIDVGVGSLSYDIINVSMGPSIDLVQDFLLDPRLYVRLAFDEAVSIGGKVVDSFVSLWDQLPDITFLADRTTVTPTFFVDADLLNRTLLDFDLDFGIDLLEIGYDFGLLGKGSVGVGNVLDQSVDLFQSPALYRKQFPLRGFNAAQGSSFVIDFLAGSTGPIGAGTDRVADPSVLPGISNTSVPEPAGLALLALGLGALASSSRRRRGVVAAPGFA